MTYEQLLTYTTTEQSTMTDNELINAIVLAVLDAPTSPALTVALAYLYSAFGVYAD